MTTALFETDLRRPAADKASLPEAVLPRASVLVIDDEPEVRSIVVQILIRFGCEVEAAKDGAAGWDSLARRSFDLVITDLVMPRLSGLELLRRLRAANPNLPVIVMSGYSPWTTADLDQLLRPGVFLDKPFTFEALIEAVHDLLPAAGAPTAASDPPLGAGQS